MRIKMTFSIIVAAIAVTFVISSYKRYKKAKEDFLFLPKDEFKKKYGKNQIYK